MLYIVVMITVVFSVDLLFFKNRFWESASRGHRYSLGVCRLLFQISEEPASSAPAIETVKLRPKEVDMSALGHAN